MALVVIGQTVVRGSIPQGYLLGRASSGYGPAEYVPAGLIPQLVKASGTPIGTGNGSVQSVGLTAAVGFTVSGSPVTQQGSLAFAWQAATTVGALPPAASNQGARMMVSDATVVAVGNFGIAATGGGSNVVPVYCDGTAWRIG